jgi:hypothetical protein
MMTSLHGRITRRRQCGHASRRTPRPLPRSAGLAGSVTAGLLVMPALLVTGGTGHIREEGAGASAAYVYHSLAGVSCRSADFCVVVGSSYDSSLTKTVPLAETWNGRAWKAVAAPPPRHATSSVLRGVSCTAANFCAAVGSYERGGKNVPLAEIWNGKTWKLAASADVRAGFLLSAVSCASPRFCMAAGGSGYPISPSPPATLAEIWNGKTWKVSPTPERKNTTAHSFSGVSCVSAHFCFAVGGYVAVGPFGVNYSIAEQWTGKTWRLRLIPRNGDSWLNSVSCTSEHACVAVGDDGIGSGASFTMADGWNGKAWKVMTIPTPNPDNFNPLAAVSCSAPDACMAVGGYGTSLTAATGVTLAERWNGKSWRITKTPNPQGAAASSLAGVWCGAPDACMAVGRYATSLTAYNWAALEERWNGTRWSVA